MNNKVHFFALKRTGDDPSNAIMLPFSSVWRESLAKGDVSVVFRKVGPHFTPDLLYAYFSTPISAVTAKIAVERYERMSVDEATKLASAGLLTPEELRKYAERWSQLVVYHIGTAYTARHPITYSVLRERFDYYISSTFTPLSGHGTKVLDELGGFA